MLNQLKIEFDLNFMQVFSSYCAANTPPLFIKNQLANPVQGNNLTLLGGSHEAH